ncbi:MAG: DUF2264 domain-containing protein [Lachnospiraceae bacterium]
MTFKPKSLNYRLSPYTGLTRESWIEAGEYLLSGIFKHIRSFDAPVIVPRHENNITYPHKWSEGSSKELERKAELFEGLARSFLIAAPLIHINPQLTIRGYSLRDYYKNQILKGCTREDINWFGDYNELQRLTGYADSSRAFQQTVETCSLVLCLNICREEIWNKYTKAERDIIADFLLSYAHAGTVPQNWRLFNMLNMAFLHNEGYVIDKDIMREHAQAILGYYAGDGWYRDGHSFDYYSCFAFNVYTPIWNRWYGYENEPYIAAQFEKNSNRLMETYGDFFDRDGFTNMWGRSNIYRNAVTSPFDANMLLQSSKANPGLARRIASGSLLQFFTREDFLNDGIPSMGFYGEFSPLIQGYSCAESVFWLGKAFLCLYLPENHPFWTEKENNGTWDKLENIHIKETVLNGPALCFTNHGANGETILRTGKVIKNINDEHGMWNYSKLSYNSKYPWEAAPSKDVEAQQYVLKDITTGNIEKCNVTMWCKSKEGVLYRRQFFNYELGKETHWMHAINLADFPVSLGIIRADKLRLYKRPVSVTLGAYGFPDNGTKVIKKELGKAKAVILKGHDYTGREKQLAMTIYDGWDSINIIHSKKTNPDSEKSIIVYGTLKRNKQYGYEPYILISQVITKESLEDFKENEIFPINDIKYTDKEKCGGYGPVEIILKDGSKKIIDFEKIEGTLLV